MTRVPFRVLFVGVALAWPGSSALGQECRVPDSVRSLVPSEAPPLGLYERLRVTGPVGGSVPLGIGHMHAAAENPVPDLPPGAYDWLQAVALPLSPAPRAEPLAWIADGWLIQAGSAEPLSRGVLIETGYEDQSFIVLESRAGGWLRIRYAPGEGAVGTGWTHRCFLTDGAVRLDFTPWGVWLARDDASPLFFRTEAAGELRAAPSAAAAVLPAIREDYVLEPLEQRGEWMRVAVREPSDYCRPDVEVSVREGWIRWFESGRGPVLWTFTRGC